MTTEQLNNIPYHQQIEWIQTGKISPIPLDFNIWDSIGYSYSDALLALPYEKNDFVFGVETKKTITLSLETAMTLRYFFKDTKFPFKEVDGKLVPLKVWDIYRRYTSDNKVVAEIKDKFIDYILLKY